MYNSILKTKEQSIFSNLYLLKFVFIFLTILSFSNLTPTKLYAQQFTTYVSQNPVPEGEMFNVTFVIKAEGQKFEAPKFKNFTVVSGPSTSSEFSFVNGRTSRQMKYTYTLRADKKGTYNIDPATIVVDGNTIKSNNVSVNVVEPSQALKEKRRQEEEANKNLNQQANDIISKNLFAKVSVNKNSAYIGEQLVATYKIYINEQLNIVDLSMSKMPSFNGFWTQGFDEKQLNYDREVINGAAFKVATVKKVVLFPQQNGNLTLDEMEFKSKVRLRTSGGGGGRRRSIFDDFFNDSYQDFDYIVTTTPIKVNIKPLPTGAPISYNGAVGNFKMEAWLDKTETKANEPITLKVKISGDGNLKLIQAPNLKLPTGFESYEPKTIDKINVSVGGMNGNIMFEYLLIPRNQGKFQISPVEFSYYDLDKKEYIELKSEIFNVTVTKGDSEGAYSAKGINKEDAKYLNQDIRYIKLNANFDSNYDYIFNSLLHYILLLIPALAFAGATYYTYNQIQLNNNKTLLKNKNATKVAQKRLKLAKKYLTENQLNQFYEELSKALWGYVSDKLSIPFSDLTKDLVKDKLTKLNVNEDTITMLLVTIDDCEFARYAPSALSKNPQDLLLFGQTVITDIEEQVK